MTLFGSTRSVVRQNYALLTPPGLVQAPLPGWHAAQCTVVISPALGARFSMLLVTFSPESIFHADTSTDEYVIYVRSGSLRIVGRHELSDLVAGHALYLPPSSALQLCAGATGHADLLVFQRPYQSLPGVMAPEFRVIQSSEIAGNPFMGDDAARLQVLLPDIPAFDMAVNIFTFQPGATLPIVETHVMEHGLLMLQGQGIYRLGDDWYPVQAGDMIWMAPFCPQWFVATGKQPAGYIYYKDVNRAAGVR